jgi:hypothetical protein
MAVLVPVQHIEQRQNASQMQQVGYELKDVHPRRYSWWISWAHQMPSKIVKDMQTRLPADTNKPFDASFADCVAQFSVMFARAPSDGMPNDELRDHWFATVTRARKETEIGLYFQAWGCLWHTRCVLLMMLPVAGVQSGDP